MSIKKFKVGDIAYMKKLQGGYSSRSLREKPFNEENFDLWVQKVEVAKVGRKYVTIGNGIWERKFDSERDYKEYVTCGGADYQLYSSKQEIFEEIEHGDKLRLIRDRIGQYGRCDLSLDQVRQIYDIINSEV